MARGTLKSNKTRDGVAATLLYSLGDLEEAMYELEGTAMASANSAAAAAEDAEIALTEMDTILESLSMSRASRLNRPNLLPKEFSESRTVPDSDVITEELTIPAEDATAAATTLTYTVTNSAITSSYKLHGVKSSDNSVTAYTSVSATFASGSATITITARSGAHSAMTVTVYLCTQKSQEIPYGTVARCYCSGRPYMDSVMSRDSSYTGQDEDGVVTSVVTLTGNDIITEPDDETYNKALQCTVETANTAWGNTEDLIFNYGSHGTMTYPVSRGPYKAYADIEALEKGKEYTLSCWARVTSGTKMRVKLAYNSKYQSSVKYCNFIDVEGSTWQRIFWTFTFDPDGDSEFTETSTTMEVDGVTVPAISRTANWYKTVSFGFSRKYAGTIQLCGFRLTTGGLWLPTKYDEIKEQVAEAETARAESQENILGNFSGTEAAKATANHAIGEVIIVGETLYRVTAAITTGETITPGTNAEAVTVAQLIGEKADADDPAFTGDLTLGSTTLTETQLQTLISLAPATGVTF